MPVALLKRLASAGAIAALLLGGAAPGLAWDAPPPSQAPAQVSCSDPASGYVLYAPVDDDNALLPGVVIADPATGEILRTIDTPVIQRLSPLVGAGLVLAYTDADGVLLIDPETGGATPLQLPDDIGTLFEWSYGLRANAGRTYTVLSDGRDAFLFDVKARAITDLRGLLPADAPIAPMQPVLSSDGQWLLMWDGQRQWLLPANDPTSIRPLTPVDVASMGASLSPDATEVVYSRWVSAKDRSRQIVAEPVDGSAEAEVIAAGDIFNAVFVGSVDRIAFTRFAESNDGMVGETVLLDRTTGDERVLHTAELNPTALLPSPDGNRILIEILANDGPFYVAIDVNTGVKTALLDPTGHYPYGPVGNRWILLAPQTGSAGGQPTPGYFALDLDAGQLTTIAPIDVQPNMVVGVPTFSLNGRAALAGIVGPGVNQLTMFDLPGKRAVVVRDSTILGAAISPDGCRFVVADRDLDAGSAPVIAVDSIGLDEPFSLGLGILPVWVSE